MGSVVLIRRLCITSDVNRLNGSAWKVQLRLSPRTGTEEPIPYRSELFAHEASSQFLPLIVILVAEHAVTLSAISARLELTSIYAED
jgi:hypothetical protein